MGRSARRPWRPAWRSRRPRHAFAVRRLLVFLRLSHDLLRGEIDVAGREGIADEEIVGLGGVIIFAILEVRIFRRRQRQLDRLRHDLALQRGDCGLDRDGDLSGAGAAGGAFQAIGANGLAQNLRKPFSVSPPNGAMGCLASSKACTTPVSPPWAVIAVEMLLHGDGVRGHLLRRRIVPFADRPRRCPTSCRSLRALPGCRRDGRGRQRCRRRRALRGSCRHWECVLHEPLPQ